jgi:microsomal dipeptidase-like Zn-dependent dipeptidase
MKYMQANKFNDEEMTVFRQMQPLFRNMFYFVEKSGRQDPSAWNHLAIGSDFDGIAKPLAFCKTAAEIPRMHAMLVKFIPHFVQYAKKSTLMHGLSSKQITDKIVFENGERFALKYF